MSKIHMALEVQFTRLPVQWSLANGQLRMARLGKPGVLSMTPVADSRGLRADFLEICNEAEMVHFLNRVGAWRVTPADWVHRSDRERFIEAEYGYERFFGLLSVVTLDHLWEEQKYWRSLMRAQKQRVTFRPPVDRMSTIMATHFNTLRVHMELRRGQPYGVVQPITGRELMMATLWADIVNGAKFQVCQRPDCRREFSDPHKRKYCPNRGCAHLMAQRQYLARQRKGWNEGVVSQRVENTLFPDTTLA